ncbi:MAG: SufE family protein [Alphaproteobacteria bacterium]|nr:SufE family protein [Alphaproteobacteria bacterium]
MRSHALAEIIDNLSLFDDWEERYAYLIDLGRALPAMAEELKSEESRVKGCTSQVWLVTTEKDGRYRFIADSDAQIVRGLVAILLAAFNGLTADEIRETDIEGAFQEMGLDQHLSPNRRSGFFAMVERVRGQGG